VLSNIIKPTKSVPNLLTNTKLKMDHAKPHLVPLTLSELLVILIAPEHLNLHLPSKADQSQLPSMPANGHLTLVVFSPTVENPSITESYSPVIPAAIG